MYCYYGLSLVKAQVFYPHEGMDSFYKHTQIGYTSLFLTLPFVIGAIVALLFGNPDPVIIAAFSLMAVICALVALFQYGLTIKVDETHVRWHFGLGAFRNKIALEKILDVEVVENTKAMGYGMRVTDKGTLYNVSGHRAVELRIKTPWKKDKFILLGTDEPEVLRDVLLERIKKSAKMLENEQIDEIRFSEPAEKIKQEK